MTKFLRWGVFFRDREGGDWAERFRWIGNDIAGMPTQWAAERWAQDIQRMHPEWEVEAQQTNEPLPGSFDETFAPLLPPIPSA